ncbi:hypothetical protein C8R42DRAFT_656607 [Lentinula raphanica]|nr:hypothetical protein C8R42DRAFT_656607 [Lentinula raphanica]
MRLRLQTATEELPPLKAWFSYPLDSPPRFIADLKNLICTTIKTFSTANISFRDIQLELDGFEILDELPTEQTLRDGDLLVITKREERSSGSSKKRKATDDGSSIPEKRARSSKSETRPSRARTVSSSSASSSSASSSSSSSESESESSDSESDSDSDSSASSLEKPTTISSHSKPSSVKSTTVAQENHVPPGLGSTKTRKRNIRRRLKKKYEASQVQDVADPIPSPPKRVSFANGAPLGPRTTNAAAPASTPTASSTIAHPNLTMFSLGNKNKKKGYKYALGPPTAQKKVFNELDSYDDPSSVDVRDEAEAEADAADMDRALPPSTAIFTSAPGDTSSKNRARVVPPSELQSLGRLPKNMFVTSVDVEADLWIRKGSYLKKKKKQRQKEREKEHPSLMMDLTQDGEEPPITLDYGAAEDEVVLEEAISSSLLDPGANYVEAADTKSALIWSVVENDYETLTPVTLDFLQNGKLVAWKALALNPETYSPEVLLHIATVTAVSAALTDENTSSSLSLSIRRLIRPGWEELDMEDVEGSFEWEDVQQMGWKAVNKVGRL